MFYLLFTFFGCIIVAIDRGLEGIKMNDNHVFTQATEHLGKASFSNLQLCSDKWDLVFGSSAFRACWEGCGSDTQTVRNETESECERG